MSRRPELLPWLVFCLFCPLGCGPTDEGGSQLADTGTWVAFEGDRGWGYRDGRGAVVIQPQFEMALDFGDQPIAFVFCDGHWACIDRNGEILLHVLPFDNGPDPFVAGLARTIDDDGRIGFFDQNGRVIIAPQFDFAFPFSEERAVACIGCTRFAEGEHHRIAGGKWGYVDKTGNWVIEARYDSCAPFKNGKAKILLNGETFFIDKQGLRVD